MHYMAGSIGVCVSGCALILFAYRDEYLTDRVRFLYWWLLACSLSVLGFGFTATGLHAQHYAAASFLTLLLGSLPAAATGPGAFKPRRAFPVRSKTSDSADICLSAMSRIQNRASLLTCDADTMRTLNREYGGKWEGAKIIPLIQAPKQAFDERFSLLPPEALAKVAGVLDMMRWNQLLSTGDSEGYSIYTLLQLMYEKSHETEAHALRLQELALRIADKLHLRIDQIEDLQLLCHLHDIGKIGIPGYILNKPGKLNTQEWDVMKSHAYVGARIIHASRDVSHISPYILTHHERWDGQGYPKGLKGKEISLLCRILGVVDAYDAMVNDRCYRPAMPHEAAIDEIIRNAGRQFDPQIVEIFLSVVEQPEAHHTGRRYACR